MGIPLNQFRWYAAFHDEGHHPHCHMVCYSADGKSGFPYAANELGKLYRDGVGVRWTVTVPHGISVRYSLGSRSWRTGPQMTGSSTASVGCSSTG